MFFTKRSILLVLLMPFVLSACIAVPVDRPSNQPTHTPYPTVTEINHPSPVPTYRQRGMILRTVGTNDRSAEKGFVIQLIATNNRLKAYDLSKQYTAQGYKAFVNDTALQSSGLYRVQIGSYATRTEASNLLLQMKNHYPNDMLVANAFVHRLRF